MKSALLLVLLVVSATALPVGVINRGSAQKRDDFNTDMEDDFVGVDKISTAEYDFGTKWADPSVVDTSLSDASLSALIDASLSEGK